MLKNLFTNVKEKYEVALSVPESANEFRDPHLYKAEEIWKYSQDFISYVDPCFV